MSQDDDYWQQAAVKLVQEIEDEKRNAAAPAPDPAPAPAPDPAPDPDPDPAFPTSQSGMNLDMMYEFFEGKQDDDDDDPGQIVSESESE